MEPDAILTVTQLTREIRDLLEGHIGSVWVEGEISNHRLQTSGHQYFTLKDAGSQLSCVMFRGAARSGVRLTDGAQVQVHGSLSVYEPRGQYQMVVKQVQMKGQGSLQAQFETLKRKLHEEGLFDSEHKQSIPKFPQIIALVTSSTGAAIQDMLNILTRRAPWIRVLVYPVRVQGLGVEKETIQALKVLNAAEQHDLPKPEVIVIGRGGGSIEDLWAYNEEALARAIYANDIPIISAVGHEIDFTIADFVADLRAPTPSAAAELLAPDTHELKRQFDAMQRTLSARITTRLEHAERVIDLIEKGALKREPQRQIQLAEQSVDDLESRLVNATREQIQHQAHLVLEMQQTWARFHPQALLTEASHRLETSGQRLQQTVIHRLERLEDRVASRIQELKHLGPQGIFARGFSYTIMADGRPLRAADEVQPGQTLLTRLHHGTVKSIVS